MTLRRTKPTRRGVPAATSTVATWGAFAVALGAVLGVGAGNMALISISLSIGVGALIGWLLAGAGPPDNARSNP